VTTEVGKAFASSCDKANGANSLASGGHSGATGCVGKQLSYQRGCPFGPLAKNIGIEQRGAHPAERHLFLRGAIAFFEQSQSLAEATGILEISTTRQNVK
jgi:hypothetical protein